MDGRCSSSDSDSDYFPENVTNSRTRKKSKAIRIKKPKREVCSNQCAAPSALSVSQLPLELLVMIFQYIVQQYGPFLTLKKYGLVNKRWRMALLENALWERVSLDARESWLNISQALKWLCKFKYCTVKELSMSSWRVLRRLGQLLPICHQVKYVEFTNCSLQFDEVFKCLDQVEKLTITQCNVKSFNVLLQTCKGTLCYLSLTEVGSSFCHSLSKCDTPLENLKVLQLDNFCKYRADSINLLQKMCPNLIRLQLSFYVLKDLPSEVNLNSFMWLKYLELSFEVLSNSSYEDQCLYILLAASPNLQSLSLIHYMQMCTCNYDEFVSLVSSSLTELALFYCQLDFMELLSKLLLCCNTLQHLTIASPKRWRVTDDIITTIIASPCINTLQYLDISGTDITINGVKSLLSCAYNLKHLDLSRCRYLPRGTKHVYSNAAELDQLKVL